MSARDTDSDRQHMLLVVESAQRAGYSESEIAETVKDAVKADADLERAERSRRAA
ncbi:MAG TPA: hypothetical protein VGH46_08105 [Gaiellaceae bacterium]